MKILAFSDWCEQEIAACKDGIKTTCPYCDGFGESECECCGHETQCAECEGEGEVIVTDSKDLLRSKTAKEKYKSKIEEDLKKFAKYIGTDFVFYDGKLLSTKELH